MPRPLASLTSFSALLLVVACGSSGDDGNDQNGNGTNKGSGPGFVTNPSGSNVSPTDVDPSSACATSSAVGQNVPASLVFMFDRSGSMKGDKWTGATTAAKAFFSDATTAGLDASLQFFPLYQNKDLVCDTQVYKAPNVAMRTLPNASDFAQAIDNIGLDETTPTLPALQGAIAYAKEVQAGGKKAAVVLVTDGEPNHCGSDVGSVETAAKAEANAVKTYVIGVGKSLTNLNKIAAAGGTGQAILVDTTNPTQIGDDLKKALGVIAAQALSCDYAIPVPGGGQTIDPNKVNVKRTPSAGGAGTTLSYNATCSGEGWRYDDVNAPKRILLCPATCDSVMKDQQGKIEVFFGCAVKGGIPR